MQALDMESQQVIVDQGTNSQETNHDDTHSTYFSFHGYFQSNYGYHRQDEKDYVYNEADPRYNHVEHAALGPVIHEII